MRPARLGKGPSFCFDDLASERCKVGPIGLEVHRSPIATCKAGSELSSKHCEIQRKAVGSGFQGRSACVVADSREGRNSSFLRQPLGIAASL